MQVLIIEDDNAVRLAYKKVLEGTGFSVTAVGDGVDAFAYLKKTKFDAILCDVALPGLEGTTFYEHLQEQYPQMADRVVFVTGYAKDANTKKLLEHTGRPYLSKPVEMKDLLATVNKLVHAGSKKK